MTVVAEGVENEEQVRALISCGVEEGQGYLVAAPLPFSKFSELLASRRATSAVAAPAGDTGGLTGPAGPNSNNRHPNMSRCEPPVMNTQSTACAPLTIFSAFESGAPVDPL
jgi:hypothetical protein